LTIDDWRLTIYPVIDDWGIAAFGLTDLAIDPLCHSNRSSR
jgi:hypothetical protein